MLSENPLCYKSLFPIGRGLLRRIKPPGISVSDWITSGRELAVVDLRGIRSRVGGFVNPLFRNDLLSSCCATIQNEFAESSIISQRRSDESASKLLSTIRIQHPQGILLHSIPKGDQIFSDR